MVQQKFYYAPMDTSSGDAGATSSAIDQPVDNSSPANDAPDQSVDNSSATPDQPTDNGEGTDTSNQSNNDGITTDPSNQSIDNSVPSNSENQSTDNSSSADPSNQSTDNSTSSDTSNQSIDNSVNQSTDNSTNTDTSNQSTDNSQNQSIDNSPNQSTNGTPSGPGSQSSGTPANTAAPGGAPFTNRSWAQLVLSTLGVSESAGNIDNVTRWMTAENPSATWWGKNNPLNVSGPAGAGGSAGTGSFPDLSSAAKATATLLGQPSMASIKRALNANAVPADFSAAVVQAPWAEGHYGVGAAGAGKYTVEGRGLNYLATIPVPSVVTATIDHGSNT
jgi:hypothetical protein